MCHIWEIPIDKIKICWSKGGSLAMKTVLANKQQTITLESKIFLDQRFKLAHPNLLYYVTGLSSNACEV